MYADSTLDGRVLRLETAFTELQSSVRELERKTLDAPQAREAIASHTKAAAAEFTEPASAFTPHTPLPAPPMPQPTAEAWTFPGIAEPFTLEAETHPQTGATLLPQPISKPQPIKPQSVYKVEAKQREKQTTTADDGPPTTATYDVRSLQSENNPHSAFHIPQWNNPQSLMASLRRTEFWLNKVGIVLFLFGVAFLFKYAIDKQWITEEARLGAGALMGSMLLIFGLRLHASKRDFSQVLMGGAIATYYITGYAAYNIFPDLNIPYEAAFAFMGLATILAFALSLWGDFLALSLIGVTGGLLTPFVLSLSRVELPFLMGYTILLLAGTSAIYLFRGWRSLLWVSLLGGLVITYGGVSEGLFGYAFSHESYGEINRIAVQTEIAALLLAFWAVPVLHVFLNHRNPTRFRRPLLEHLFEGSQNIHLYILTVFVPVVTLGLSMLVGWGWGGQITWGWVSVAGAAILLAVGYLVRHANGRLAYLHALVAIGLLNIGLLLLLQGNWLLLALALEAACLHLISFRFKDVGMEVVGTLGFGAVGLWLMSRLVPGMEQSPAIFNPQTYTDLAVLGLAFGASFLVKRVEISVAYRSLFHLVALALIWREVSGFPNGDGYVMLAWAAYGILLHLVARKLDSESLVAKGTTIAAHVAFEGALGLLAYRMATGYSGSTPLLNQKAAMDLLVMGMALVTSFLVGSKRAGMVYRLVVHAAALGWLWREATTQDFINGYVMLRWTAYVATVAFISHRLRDRVTLQAIAAPFPIIAALFAWRITLGPVGGSIPFLNTNTLVDLCVLAMVMAVSFVAQPREVSVALRLGFHAGVLALLWRELPTDYLYGYTMFAWAAYVAIVQFVSCRLRDHLTSLLCNVPFAVVGSAFMVHMMLARLSSSLISFFNPTALLELGVILLALVISFVAHPPDVKLIYRIGVHAAALALLWHELSPIANGYMYLMFACAAYAALLYLIAWRANDGVTQWVAHAIAAATGVWMLGRIAYGLIMTNSDATPIFNPQGLSELGVILLAGLVYWLVRSDRWAGLAVGLWLHLAVLGWTWQELGLIEQGNGYVTVAWGIYALALLGAAFRLDRNRALMLCGLTTLFAIAAKLFLIDLRYLEAIWRILLFLGFGALFLVISYFFQNALKRTEA